MWAVRHNDTGIGGNCLTIYERNSGNPYLVESLAHHGRDPISLLPVQERYSVRGCHLHCNITINSLRRSFAAEVLFRRSRQTPELPNSTARAINSVIRSRSID